MPVFECVIDDITYRNEQNGWTVMRLKDGRDQFAAVGIMPFVTAGERVRLTGEWGEHPTYGRRLQVSLMEPVEPETKSDIERYLASGLIKGVGPATARLIIHEFGADAMAILESQPDRLCEIDGIGPKRAKMIAESFAEQREMRQLMIFLQSYEITPALAMKIHKRFGMATQEIVRTNPYLLVDEVDGVGFKTADNIAYSAGIPRESEYRLQSGLKYILGDASSGMGHVYLPREELIEQSKLILAVDLELIERALQHLVISGQMIECQIDGVSAIYLGQVYEAEVDVAKRMVALKQAAGTNEYPDVERHIARYEQEEGVELCREQREAVTLAVTSGVSVITGGPGTGKTTSIKCIISLISHVGEVMLAAPTGRAAKRMSEATGCPAKTIHRMLEFGGDENVFQKNEENMLEAKMVIVDEMSMMDIFLMRSLLMALKPGTRLVMVGDADQLPSVGAGNVLRDLINSETLPVVQLNFIFRQASESMIVNNAHRINHGQMPVMNGKDSDFFLERKESVQSTVDSVLALVTQRLPGYMGLDPLRDIQVLSPTKKGEAGVWALNRMMQGWLNPKMEGVPEWFRGESVFRLGDKVMQIKNDYQLEWTRGSERGEGVYNGDIGYITEIDREESTIEVTFDDERVALYEEGDIEELELAYCMSVHKSQGSEFPALVIPLFSGPMMLMTRNLLYTAVTRARKLVVIVGREECIAQMVANNRIQSRYSALDRRLREADAK